MTALPESLQPFQSIAKKILANRLVREVEFSGRTYQIQVIDPETEEECWTFIQLDDRGNIKDCFCSCEASEDLDYCAHLAAAFLSIYQGTSQPLHQRFENSIWNLLCCLYASRVGEDPDLLTKPARGHYQLNSLGGKVLFSIKAKDPVALEQLEEIIEHRRKLTEETSIKFSNLSNEEMTLWREGRPSAQLRYELSFWNDLARWLMRLQETGEQYEVKFRFSEVGLPNYLHVTFATLEVLFYISEANLPFIIPTLALIDSPLKIYQSPQASLKRITYDKRSGALLIEPHAKKEGDKRPEGQGKQVGNWLYLPKKGFYGNDPHALLSTPQLMGSQVAEALNKHFHLVKEHLEGTTIHSEPISLSYSLNFDSEWNLHIVGYLFSPGDLTTGDSRYFGDNWVYLDDDGFYPVSNVHFDSIQTKIPAKQVGDFVQRERHWLSSHEGFQPHVSSVEAEMTYTLSSTNQLSFIRRMDIPEKEGGKDFGTWAYIAGQGFYSKTNIYTTTLPLGPEIALHADQIPIFIRMNRAELQMIPHFFSERSPIEKAGLTTSLLKGGKVRVTPVYERFPEYAKKEVKFFDEFTYVEGEGFHELMGETWLPERFRSPLELSSTKVDQFILEEWDTLQQYSIQLDPRLQPILNLDLVTDSIEKDPKSGRYLTRLYYQAERGKIPLTDVLQAVKKKRRFLFTEAGRVDLKDSKFDWLKLIQKKQIEQKESILHLSALEFIRIHALEDLHLEREVPEQDKQLFKELVELHQEEVPDLTGLKSKLRPYQKLGVHWLWFLYRHHLSGLLCDDMGLGKTHQAMALLTAIVNAHKREHKKPRKPFLVICPTSVIFHWQEKLAEFCPDIRVLTFHGSSRTREEIHQREYDLILTSYGIWRLESEFLRTFSYEVAIFDEVQIAKNHNSRIYATLRHIDSDMRLGLTGTPIENHLRELKALFDIVLPSYMPGETDYREKFVKPIERDQDPTKRNLLSRFIKPFVMRRKKVDVLPDLPEKTEQVSHCNLMPEQQTLYMEVLHRSRNHLLEQLRDSNQSVPYVHIFALLSALKQICNHPAVYLKCPEEYKIYTSGKWELFTELLGEARDSQQKVVIFSQYLGMLDIFELYLNELGIGFATIRGSTQNRGEQVFRFNNDPNCQVFLGSLQAAGLGVDLTGASVVIHYDRWWNAARESQATDRVHRIGQTKGVQVFKLVTKDTFEERIDELITKKAHLMEEVVSVDDHRFMKMFNREELVQLLQDIQIEQE